MSREHGVARIRHITIKNFKCIQEFSWYPSSGINALIGPGDTGKSTVLDAIDLCLGARRSVQFCDDDFYLLDVEQSISITITMGELDESLKNMEAYGNYLRSYDSETGAIEDEPEKTSETVLTLNLTVGSDLEPAWTLVSDRTAAQGAARYLTWTDRVKLCPTRIDIIANHNLAWRRGSVLNRLSDERLDTSSALVDAARTARDTFGDLAEKQLGETLAIVVQTAKELGVPVGDKLKAMLDAHSISFGAGIISLHNADGVPLRGLGIGSARLLTAGLQRKAAKNATIILIDELEHGLEPHRIIRLLGSIGAKEVKPPLQAFITTHSPVVLRELAGDQLVVIRKMEGQHQADWVGTDDAMQGTIRKCPEAFLAPLVIICEGASEVGLLRGLDLYYVAHGNESMMALGIALVDANGCDSLYQRADPFRFLGYRTAVLRDDDKQPDPAKEATHLLEGGALFKWRPGRALEDELFLSLPDDGVVKLLVRAIDLLGEELVAAHIGTASDGFFNLADCRAGQSAHIRSILGAASRSKKNPWFKSVGRMEEVARDIVGPCLTESEANFQASIEQIGSWMSDAGK